MDFPVNPALRRSEQIPKMPRTRAQKA